MKRLLAPIFIFLAVCNLYAQNFQSEHFFIEKLADGVYAAIHKTGGYAICNAGIIDLGGKTLVFDCFISPKAARDLKKAAEELTGNKVKYLVNSHWHNDHIRGNQVFTDAEIISTRRTKELIEQNEPEELKWEAEVVDKRIETTSKSIAEEKDTAKLEESRMWMGYYKAIKESFSEYNTTLPNLLFTDTLHLNGSSREVYLISQGEGHTESDIVLWLPKEKILFTGDLLFVECHPWLGDGFMDEWIGNLEELKKLNAKLIIPGHGSVGNNSHLDPMINYIIEVNQIVDNAIDQKVSEDELKATSIPLNYRAWWFGRFFTPNVVMQYNAKINKK